MDCRAKKKCVLHSKHASMRRHSLLSNQNFLNTKNSYIESDKRLVSVIGLQDIGIVETPDAVMVFSLKDSESVKQLVQVIESQG